MRQGPRYTSFVPGVMLLLGGFTAWAGHDVTDSARSIVVAGGWAVTVLGLAVVGTAVALMLRAGESRSR